MATAAWAAWAACTRKPVVGRKTKGASTTRVPPPFFLQLRSFVRLPGISPAGKPSPAAPFAASIAGQTRSRGDIAPGSRTGELAEAPARRSAEQTRAPAPALWNSPALVVTGAMASRALCAALDNEADYPAETIVMQEARGSCRRRSTP